MFQTQNDYALALLRLMARLQKGTVREILDEFEKENRSIIPNNHRVPNTDGTPKWETTVRFARSDWIRFGMFANAPHGYWEISEAGLLWLQKHPDDIEAINSIRALMREKNLSFQTESRSSQPADRTNPYRSASNQEPTAVDSDDDGYDLAPNLQGLFYREVEQVLVQKLLTFASQAHIHANPEGRSVQIGFPEFSHARYAIELRQADDISFRFESPVARINFERLNQILPYVETWQKRLGFPVLAEKWGQKRARLTLSLSNRDKRKFLGSSAYGYDSLVEYISHLAGLPGANIFEVTIKKSAEQLPSGAPFWQIKAHAYASLMAELIETTLPNLQPLFPEQKRVLRAPVARSVSIETQQHHHSHQLLEQKINEIQDFLAGRAVRTPKDEELCDWIQLCYLFDLPREGQRLFTFVQPQSLNNEWLYHRTKKYADLCRLKAPNQG